MTVLVFNLYLGTKNSITVWEILCTIRARILHLRAVSLYYLIHVIIVKS